MLRDSAGSTTRGGKRAASAAVGYPLQAVRRSHLTGQTIS